MLRRSGDRASVLAFLSYNLFVRLFHIAILALSGTFAWAQGDKPLADAGTTICEYSRKGGGLGKWLTSTSGFSAAVELRAVVTGEDKQRRCTTSWILHLRGQDGQVRTLMIAEREDVPEDNEWIQENSFEINAWSPDGSMLLASQIEVQGDGDTTTPIIYDFKSGKHWRVELYPLFKKSIVAGCYVVYRALGFKENGVVLISAMSTDDDREAGTEPCFPESRWSLDFRHNTISHDP